MKKGFYLCFCFVLKIYVLLKYPISNPSTAVIYMKYIDSEIKERVPSYERTVPFHLLKIE